MKTIGSKPRGKVERNGSKECKDEEEGGRRKEEGGSRLVREGEAFVGIFSKSAVQRLTSPRARAVIHRKESTRVDGTWK